MKKFLISLFILFLGISIGFSINEFNSGQGYAKAIEAARPAVVNVFSKTTVKSLPSPYELMAREHSGQNLEGFHMPQMEEVKHGQGSGVIVSPDGYIVTNYHVVGDADSVTVTLSDGVEVSAEIIGSDPQTDLTLLKMKREAKRKYNYLPLANSNSLKVGDIVLAIGNSFGIGQASTMGIVSALKREDIGLVDYEDYIQTDVVVNPGNSGGALIDTKGRLMGINTGFYSSSGGYQGISFAVPSNQAKNIISDLKQYGRVNRLVLGIKTISLDAHHELTDKFLENTDYDRGALIIDVKENSLAQKIGLTNSVLLTELDNQPISNAEDFLKKIGKLHLREEFILKGIELDIETCKTKERIFHVKSQE